MSDELIEATVTGWDTLTGAGSLVIFYGITNDDDSRGIRFGVANTLARPLIDALESGEEPEVALEPWQVLRA